MLKRIIGVKSDILGSINGIISRYKRIAPDTAKSLTFDKWKSFDSKARSDRVYDIIINKYGSIKGQVVHDSMIQRMDIFKDKFGEFI